MGAISDLARRAKQGNPSRRGEALWRQAFGGTSKEDLDKFPRVRPTPGGRWTRTATAEPAAFKRLLQAMRSMAPGGWSDDRYEQTRQLVGIQYIANHRLGMMYQQSEFQVFVKDSKHQDGKRPVTPEDKPHGEERGAFNVRPYDLVKLLEKPNRQDSFGKMMYRWNQQKGLTGTALTWMVPNAAGIPFELYCVPTAIAIPQPSINPDYPDGFYRIQPLYPYGPFSSYPTPSTAVGAPIPAQWMLRFQYPHPLLRYEGYSPYTGLRSHIDQLNAIDKSRFYNMRRVFNPSAVLNMDEVEGMDPLPESEIERIRAEFENVHQSPENVGTLFVGFPGGKIEPWGTSPREMDYQQSWEQLVSFILGGLGITKPAAGMIEDSSYATLFATLKQLALLTLTPECDDYASDLTRHLAPFFGDDLIVEIRCKRIDDHDINFQKVDKLLPLKGMPISVIKLALKLMDIPVEEELVMELSKAGQPQGQPGMAGPGMVGAEGQPQGQPEQQSAVWQNSRGTYLTRNAAGRIVRAKNPEKANAQSQGVAGGMEQSPQQAPQAGGEEEETVGLLDPTEEEEEMRGENTGPLGRGSLGPRKHWTGRRRTKVLASSNGRE